MTDAPFDLSAKRSVIFDLDGTLIDSSAAHARAFHDALAERHPGIARAFDYDSVRGMPTPAAISALGIDDAAEIARLTQDKRTRYLQALRAGAVRAYPDAERVVERLALGGRRLFVVTAASGEAARTVLELVGLAARFEFVFSVEQLDGSKESGRPFEVCVGRFGLDREQTVVVEDAADGIRGAQTAGLAVVQIHRRVVEGVPFYAGFGELGRGFGL